MMSLYKSNKDCGGCNGRGSVPGSFGYDGRCAACGGRGRRLDKPAPLLEKRWARFLVAYPGLAPFREDEKVPDIALDILDRALHSGKAPSEKQVSMLLDIRRRDQERRARWAAETAAAPPCPTGRVLIEGVVLSAKWKTGNYGDSLKLTIKHDSGWKAWGSMPKSLEDAAYVDSRGEPRVYLMATTLPEYLRGRRVSFTATLSPSREDKSFGFYKRPGRDAVLHPEEERPTWTNRGEKS